MGKKETIQLRPRGHENDPAVEEFELSDYDHFLPKIYTLITLTFKAPADKAQAAIVDELKAGLEITLSQYRSMCGALQTDPQTGKVWIVKKKDSTVDFIVNHIDAPDDDTFPSYAALERDDFPAGKMDGDQLLPTAQTQRQPLTPMGEDADDDTPILVAQVNFIRGGVIVAVAVHHCCSDGPGTDGFLSQWAANTRAAATGAPLPSFDARCLDRTPLISHATPSPEWMAATEAKIRSLGHVKTPPQMPAGFTMPPLSQVMFHFSASGTARLKADAQPPAAATNGANGAHGNGGGGGAWVSTYDSIMAVLWRSMTRSRLAMPFAPADPAASPSHLLHAVGVRKLVGLPENYLGNALLLPKPGVPVAALVAPGNLPLVASTVRASIKEYTAPDMIKDTSDWIAGTENKAWISIKVNGFLGMDVCGTSWGTMTAYTSGDFGWGRPAALRRPKPTVDGYIFMYPRRPKEDPEEGTEVCVCLESSCMERLLKDEELARYAQPRGL